MNMAPIIRNDSNNLLRSLMSAYYNFLFKETDSRLYAIFRITFSIALLVNFIELWDLQAILFSNKGMLDQSVVANLNNGHLFYSIFYHFQSPQEISIIFHIAAFAILFMAIGLFTRASVLIVYCFQLSCANSASLALCAWDQVFTLFCFILLISPLGEIWSLDRFIKKILFKHKVSNTEVRYGLFLMQIQFCIIYLGSAGLKLYEHYWLNGELFSYYILSINSKFPYLEFAHYKILSKILTYGCLLIEIAVPFLLFNKSYKWIAIFLGVSLHITIMFTSNITTFSLVMLTLFIPFFDPLNKISMHTTWNKIQFKCNPLHNRLI